MLSCVYTSLGMFCPVYGQMLADSSLGTGKISLSFLCVKYKPSLDYQASSYFDYYMCLKRWTVTGAR